jgi:hypothetical protein
MRECGWNPNALFLGEDITYSLSLESLHNNHSAITLSAKSMTSQVSDVEAQVACIQTRRL